MTVNRRTFLCGSTLAVLPLPAAAAIAQGTGLRVGMLTVKTGTLAQGGIQMEQGITAFLKERKYTLADRKVELIVADTGGNPAGAKSKVQELVERDHVDFIIGPLAAHELLAITDYVREAKMPMLGIAGAEDVTQRKPNPWFVRASATSSQSCHPLANYAATELKARRVATIAEDFAYGYEQAGGFLRVFEETGGRIVKKLWPPVMALDYSPYIAQISELGQRHELDYVFQGLGGAKPVRFMRQYADYGLKDKIPLLGGETAVDDAILKSLGDETVGAISASFYSSELDTPSNKRFVEAMLRDYGNIPGMRAAGAYLSGMCIEAALEKTGGRTDDKEALIKALRAVSLTDTPRGPFRFDHLGNVVGNVFIRRVERKKGKLVNTIVKTYPNVSQFWTYDEKWFLAQPVYSRDYPAAKYLE